MRNQPKHTPSFQSSKRSLVAAILAVWVGLFVWSGLQAKGPKSFFYTKPTNHLVAKVKAVDYSPLVKQVKPAVFNISVTGNQMMSGIIVPKIRRKRHRRYRNPFEFFFDHELSPFRIPLNPNRRAIPFRSSGSGFLINEKGFGLTNYHVIKNAKKIVAQLEDGREFPVKVIGKSALLDLALIKLSIPRREKLPYVFLGRSEKLYVGEPVVAIGNAKGLGLTVTAGIVSAKGRVIGSSNYDNYIQTDAAINQGNSGGPLFNLRGEVVGINTAIMPGGRGIGFAIPIDLARQVLPQLRTKGRVERAQLGVIVQKMTPALAHSFGLDRPRGALISKVVKGSAAEKAGLRVGDVILRFNNRVVRNHHHLPLFAAFQTPGHRVVLDVLRRKKHIKVTVVLQKWDDSKVASEKVEPKNNNKKTALSRLGIQVEPLSAKERKRLDLPGKRGLRITNVQRNSLAAQHGIRERDVLLEVNRQPVHSVKQLKDLIAQTKSGDNILLLLRRNSSALFIAFPLP